MIKLHNKDCMVAMAGFSDNQFDLAIVDPPYGIGMAGGKWGNSKTNFKNFAGNDESIPQPEYYEQLIRVSKNYIVWGGNYMTEYLPPKPCFIVWDKVQPQEFTMAMAELAITSFDNPAKIFKQRIVGANKNGKIHPTQKPVKLYEWLLMNYAKEGDKILDTHLGSGSIAIACHNLGYDLTGYEIDTEYYEAAIKRLKQHQSQLRMF